MISLPINNIGLLLINTPVNVRARSRIILKTTFHILILNFIFLKNKLLNSLKENSLVRSFFFYYPAIILKSNKSDRIRFTHPCLPEKSGIRSGFGQCVPDYNIIYPKSQKNFDFII